MQRWNRQWRKQWWSLQKSRHRRSGQQQRRRQRKAGDTLVVLEAMKMEIEVSAPVDGTVKSVSAVVGTAVNTDDLLVTLG